jgi:hypothetical protein
MLSRALYIFDVGSTTVVYVDGNHRYAISSLSQRNSEAAI